MNTLIRTVMTCMLTALFSVACAAADSQQSVTKTTSGVQNVAAAWCEKKGGKVITIKTNARSATSTGRATKCLLPSGELIDQWKLYKRDNE
ncbi:DUF333 domain-containing protein [Brenneria tiliae]|uniref:DUF333 domain-containing protein n=1 Tax=Brenneria tiliae TaxID=2914984 RepID=UPI0020148549|nr:DUF333 domain-containing protein [Brenneria tiliae]MCL2899841.1 DUF333 domain-containing protein [Brenneria tiliae]MCL2904670.1 DUF333 domain-containing protein [Brenneria tiliae]